MISSIEKYRLEVNVNDRDYVLYVDPNETVLQVLREDMHLLGSKEGCDDGNCGVCTVLVDGQAVKSCMLLAPQVSHKKILTIEGLEKDDRLHPLQQAFIDYFAVQCGFCTPGMIMTAIAILEENPQATEEDIREGLTGNLCRCTGYTPIVEAIEAVRDGEYK